MDTTRRDILRMAMALGLGHTIGPLALGRNGLPGPASGSGYKALVCLFLTGGNDAAGMLLATDPDSWARYQMARNVPPFPIALAPPGSPAIPGALATLGASALGGVLPIVPKTPQGLPGGTAGTGARTFALHPSMPNLQKRFSQGQLAFIANVGPLVRPITKAAYLNNTAPVPANLFAHDAQQAIWQAGGGPGTNLGWGGLMADVITPGNANPDFTAITLSGYSPLLAGKNTGGYQVAGQGAVPIQAISASSLFGSTVAPGLLSRIITTPQSNSPFETGYCSVVALSMASANALNTALGQMPPVPPPPSITDPMTGGYVASPLAQRLQTVASLISAGQALGMKRQIFFVSDGPYDTHQNQNSTWHSLIAGMDTGLDYFYRVLSSLNGQDLTAQVTTCTLSDFGRAFASNGSGTDHGWGGHHLVLGGSVKGGDIYGTYPSVGVDGGTFTNPDALPSPGAWIPTLPVDQYAATLGAWMGLSTSQLLGIFPNLPNFPGGANGLGFL